MNGFDNKYIGIILFFIFIGLYLLNFVRKASAEADWITNFFLLFGALSVVIGFIQFYQQGGKIFALTLASLLALLIGSFFSNNIGSKNNVSLMGVLLYFITTFGIVFLWKNTADAKNSSSPNKTDGTTTTPPPQFAELLKNINVKYLGVFTAYAVLVSVLYMFNPAGIMTKYGGISIFLSLFVGLLLVGLTLGYSALNTATATATASVSAPWLNGLYIFLSLFVSGLLLWWLLQTFGVFSNNADQQIGSIIFNLVLLLGVLTLVYKMSYLGDWIASNSFVRLLINSFLYIPCLFADLLDRMRGKTGTLQNPFKGTKPSDVIALLAVLGTIFLYFVVSQWIIPGLQQWYFLKGGKQVVHQPVSIDQHLSTSSFTELNELTEEDIPQELKPNYHYGISFWLYVDSFPPSTNAAYSEASTVLNYGGVPIVKFFAPTNTLAVYIQNTEHHKKVDRLLYSHDNVRLQKWNNVVINYLNGTMDIFYNGKLVSSSIEVSPPIIYDTLTVGMNNGISGSVCNVVFYKEPLTMYSIQTLYDSLKNTSPPTA